MITTKNSRIGVRKKGSACSDKTGRDNERESRQVRDRKVLDLDCPREERCKSSANRKKKGGRGGAAPLIRKRWGAIRKEQLEKEEGRGEDKADEGTEGGRGRKKRRSHRLQTS